MLIFKQLCIADSPAQESVCKGTNLHRKIKLCWYLDNCASLIVLRKNRYVKDDNLHRYHIRQGVAEDPGLMHRVKKVAFRTRLQSGLSPRVYNHHFFTRNDSLLDLNWQCHAPKLMNVNQECHLLFCHSFLPLARHWCPVLVGTPEARFLYQRHLFVHLVHQKHVSCTNGAPQYIRCITKASSRTFSVLRNNRRPFFQVWKVMRT